MAKRKFYFENEEGEEEEMPDSETDQPTSKRSRPEGSDMVLVPVNSSGTVFDYLPRHLVIPGHPGQDDYGFPIDNVPLSAWRNDYAPAGKRQRGTPQVEELGDDELVTDQTVMADRFRGEPGNFARYIPERHGALKYYKDVHARSNKYRNDFGRHGTAHVRKHVSRYNSWIGQHNDRLLKRRDRLHNKSKLYIGSHAYYNTFHQDWLDMFNFFEHPREYTKQTESLIRDKIGKLSAAELRDMLDEYISYRFKARDY